jgi:hypothetical protein
MPGVPVELDAALCTLYSWRLLSPSAFAGLDSSVIACFKLLLLNHQFPIAIKKGTTFIPYLFKFPIDFLPSFSYLCFITHFILLPLDAGLTFSGTLGASSGTSPMPLQVGQSTSFWKSQESQSTEVPRS